MERAEPSKRSASGRGLPKAPSTPKGPAVRPSGSTRVPGLVVNQQRNGRYYRAQVAMRGLRLVSRGLDRR